MIIDNKLIILLTPDIQNHDKLTVKIKSTFNNLCIKNEMEQLIDGITMGRYS